MKKLLLALLLGIMLIMNYNVVLAENDSTDNEEKIAFTSEEEVEEAEEDENVEIEEENEEEDEDEEEDEEDDVEDDEEDEDENEIEIDEEEEEIEAEEVDNDETEKEYLERLQMFYDERELNEEEDDLIEELEAYLDDEEDNQEAIEELKTRIKELEEQAAELRKILKEEVLSKYSDEELEQLEEVKAELEEEYEELTIIEVDSIISNDMIFKFDTPPVIKEGRTLVPVRGISEGFQADVQWDGELQQIIIVKDEKIIKLTLGENTAEVNGKMIEMDTKAELMNSRTMVPLRFIAEALGLTTEWNPVDKTIEVIDETNLKVDTQEAPVQ